MTQNTVDSYLEDVILESTFDTASEQARFEIQEQAAAIDAIANDMEAKCDDVELIDRLKERNLFFSLLDELN